MFKFPFFNQNKGDEAKPVLSDEKGLLVQPSGGKWSHACKQGQIFTGNAAAAGVTLPIYSNTAQVFGIWNPPNSGVLAELISLRMTYVSGTGAAGGYVLGLLEDVPALAGTASPISAFTKGVPRRGRLGSQTGGNKVFFTPSAATVTTGLMVIGRNLGINQLVTTAAEDEQVAFRTGEDFDGDLCLEPGNALFLAGNIATVCVWAPSLTWREVPI